MKIFILSIVVSLILLSCIFSPDNEDFSFKIKVKDLDGNPVKGLNVTLLNKFEHQFGPEFDWPKANTTISLHLDRTAFVELIIQDIENNNIRTLSSSEFSEGNHSFVWNGKNDDDSYVSSGVYYCLMKASENDTLFYQHETIMYLSSFNQIHKNGSTNVDGTFEASKQPFINLYSYPDSIKLVDEESNNLGIEEFSDTTAICLFDPDSDDHQFEYVVVKDKNNTFNIIWDPETSWKSKKKLVTTNKGSDDDLFGGDTELYGNYPNPFN